MSILQQQLKSFFNTDCATLSYTQINKLTSFWIKVWLSLQPGCRFFFSSFMLVTSPRLYVKSIFYNRHWLCCEQKHWHVLPVSLQSVWQWWWHLRFGQTLCKTHKDTHIHTCQTHRGQRQKRNLNGQETETYKRNPKSKDSRIDRNGDTVERQTGRAHVTAANRHCTIFQMFFQLWEQVKSRL